MSMMENDEMFKFMVAANFAPKNPEMMMKFIYFCDHSTPADKEMLPRMVALLEELHKSGAKTNQWYFKMQECIKNHYRSQGICFFFKDAKEILKGKKSFDVMEAFEKEKERVENNCIQLPLPFGLKAYF
jgi:hypothetical protein